MKKFLAVLVAAALSGVAVVGTSSSADIMGLGLRRRAGGAMAAGATVPDVAAAAGAIAAWAGDRVASPPVLVGAVLAILTTTIRCRLIRLITITPIRRRPITTMAGSGGCCY